MPYHGLTLRAAKAHVTTKFSGKGASVSRRFALLSIVASMAIGLGGSVNSAAAETSTGPADPELEGQIRTLFPTPPDLDFSGNDIEQEEVIPGRYIVVLDDSVGRPGEVAREQARERDGELGVIYDTAFEGYVIDNVSRADASALREDPRVESVEPDRRIHLESQTVSTGVSRIFAPSNAALDIDETDDARVNADVAVIDGRIDYTHPDLNVILRIDCVPAEEGAEPVCATDTGTAFSKHGTRVAGIIGGIDNGFGVVGAAPGVRLWGIRVFDEEGNGQTSWTNTAIEWVADHAAEIEVANMSLGGAGDSPSQDKAIGEAATLGVVPVVAAGNQSENAKNRHPAKNPDVITVSALADYDGKPGGTGAATCIASEVDDTAGSFSNWGDAVEIAAPGVCINSTEAGGGYAFAKYGTSFATPHVSGAAALLASKANPQSKADVEAIRQELVDGGSLDWTDTAGDGKPEPVLYLGNAPLTQVEAATGGWSSTDGASVTFTGAFNTRGAAGQYQFEYGPTTAYGSFLPATPAQVSVGTKYRTVSQVADGLEPGETYHYRLSVTTSAGTVYGKDRVLTAPRFLRQSTSSAPAVESEWINDVSCPTAGFCMGTGYYREKGNHISAYELSNGQFGFSSLPLPEGATYPQAFGVSCSSSTDCTAVGRFQASGATVPLALRWNGTSWSTQSVPLPYAGAPSSVLNDVSCASATECMAVGYYKDAEGTFVNYAARWKGGSWTSMSPPVTSGSTQSMLEDVSCVNVEWCTAVGWINSGGSGSKPVIVTWNGSSWSLGSPARTGGSLYGISCISTNFCAAVGARLDTETWDGSEWTSHPAAKAAEADGGYLEGVSCTSSTYCAAVGSSWIGPHQVALAEVWDGSSWQVESSPREAEAGATLNSVGCITLNSCQAVGGSNDGNWDSLFVERKDVVTEGPSEILPGQALLRGVVNPGGSSTTYKFEFGRTTAYGSSVPISGSSAGAGADPVEVSKQVKELEPESVYHYRLSATNGAGTTYGQDRTFRSGTPEYHLARSFGTSGTGKGQVDAPWGLDVDAEGNLWVADRNNNRVEKYSPTGQFLLTVGGEVNKTTHGNICTAASGNTCGIGVAGSGSSQFREPLDIAVTASNDLWVTDGGNNRVQKLNSKGEYLGQFGSSGTGNGQFTEPWGIDIASNGDIWVADARYSRAQKFTSSGSFILKVTGLEGPRGLEVGSGDHVWVTERTTNHVQELSSSGEKLSQFGTAGTGPGQFDEPQAVDMKSSGDLLVTDRFNDRVQQFSADGSFVAQFGNNEVVEPRGVTVSSGSTVYVSNSWKDRIDEWQQNVPAATTEGTQGITSSGASLGGKVNPRGVSTEYRFEYGKTTSYGSQTSNESAGSGTSDLSVGKSISGLEPNTTYHVRVVAFSSEGLIYGKDSTFTTKISVPKALSALSVTEPFNGSTESLSNFASKWSPLGWAGGSGPKGLDTSTGWRASDAYPTVNGAAHNPTFNDGGNGVGAVATLATSPGSSSRYFSLWLDMPTPTGAKTGYELRFTYTASNTYTVALSRWTGGSSVTLASKTGASLAVGNSVALVDQGGTVSAWTNTGSGFAELLGASDTTYSSGSAGVEAAGNSSRLINFSVGGL